MTGGNPYEPIIGALLHGYLPWILPLLIGLGGLRLWLLPKLRGMEGEALVGRELGKLGAAVLNDFVLPDGKGGLTQIDHVALTGAGLLVVETKNYSGQIFGTERDRQWTQKLGPTTHRFQNPLLQNSLHVKAVEALQLEVPVHGMVVFTNAARFPKGLPVGVSQLWRLEDDLDQQSRAAPSEAHNAAWGRLKQLAVTDRAAKKAHLAALAQKHGPDRRRPIGQLMAAASALWLLTLAFAGHVPSDIAPALFARDTKQASFTPASSSGLQPTPAPRAALRERPRTVVGYREERVPGKPLEDCLGLDKELNADVLRCRNGYMQKVPIFSR